MSFSFCCRSLSEDGFRRHRLRDEEEEDEEGDRERMMNISELREEYRSSRERQRRNIQVLIYRAVSVELQEAISIIPINQNLASQCGLYSSSPPDETFDQDLASCDPWLVPLGLHQLSCPRRSLSSSKTTSSQHLVDPPSSSSSDVDHINTSRSRGDPDRLDLQSSGSNSPEWEPQKGSNMETSITCPPCSSTSTLLIDLKENQSKGTHTWNTILQNSSSAWRGSRKFTRQLSVGGLGQNQNFPFPSRKTRRVSEATQRLGMYSSI